MLTIVGFNYFSPSNHLRRQKKLFLEKSGGTLLQIGRRQPKWLNVSNGTLFYHETLINVGRNGKVVFSKSWNCAYHTLLPNLRGIYHGWTKTFWMPSRRETPCFVLRKRQGSHAIVRGIIRRGIRWCLCSERVNSRSLTIISIKLMWKHFGKLYDYLIGTIHLVYLHYVMVPQQLTQI